MQARKPRIWAYTLHGARFAYAQQERNKMPMLQFASTTADVDEYIFSSTLFVTTIYLYIPTINIRIWARRSKRTYWMQTHQKSRRDAKNSIKIAPPKMDYNVPHIGIHCSSISEAAIKTSTRYYSSILWRLKRAERTQSIEYDRIHYPPNDAPWFLLNRHNWFLIKRYKLHIHQNRCLKS